MKEKLINITIILISILAPILIIPQSIGNTYLPKLIALLILGAMLLFLILSNYKKLYIDKIDILLLTFGGLVILSTLFSSNIKKSVIGENNRYEGMLMFLIYILIFLSVKKFFKKEYIKTYINIMYIVILLICILSICQYYITTIDLGPIFSTNKSKGSSGTFGNSNFLGSFVSIFLPISIATYIMNGKKRYLILSGMLFITMLLCVARSSWVAFIIYFLITTLFILYKRKKEYFKRLVLILMVFICSFVIISYTGKENIISKNKKMVNEVKQISTTGITENMGSGRIAIWKMTIKLIKSNPLIGVGPDNLKEGLFNNTDIRYNELYNFFVKTRVSVDKAHNEYLQIAATIGIPALIIYLTFIGIICFKNLKVSLKDNARFILLLSILSYLVQAFFNISTIGIAPLFWIILGLISNDNVIKEINEII